MDMLNIVKADVSSVSPSSEQRVLRVRREFIWGAGALTSEDES